MHLFNGHLSGYAALELDKGVGKRSSRPSCVPMPAIAIATAIISTIAPAITTPPTLI